MTLSFASDAGASQTGVPEINLNLLGAANHLHLPEEGSENEVHLVFTKFHCFSEEGWKNLRYFTRGEYRKSFPGSVPKILVNFLRECQQSFGRL